MGEGVPAHAGAPDARKRPETALALATALARRRRRRGGLRVRLRHPPVASVALAFALVAVTGYVLLERDLAHLQIGEYAEGQRADARAFELEGARASGTTEESATSTACSKASRSVPAPGKSC